MKTSAAVTPPARKGAGSRRRPSAPTETLLDLFKEFDGLATDLPADFAAQHDHYLYGTPKRAAR